MADTTVLVTGGNRGIGLEICRQLAARGATVWLAARDAAKGEAARVSLGPAGTGIRVVAIAVDSPSSIAAAAKQVAAGGSLDVLINNAGVFDKADAPSSRLQLEVLERTFRSNLYGPLLLSQAMLPLLKKSRSGRIINLSSGMGQLSDMGSGSAAYRISKTALNAMSATLAAELADDHIAVNAVCPGWVKTDMGGAGATREVAKGADTPVWLALDAPPTLTGKLLRDRTVIPW